MFENLKEKLISYIYNVSKQPVKFATLLEANQLFNEGMKLDGTILGFRLRLARAYVVFIILAHILIAPIALITHSFFSLLDCHASIIIAVFFTAWLFGIFSFFKEWTRDSVTRKRIKDAWALQFPYFPYDEYNKSINDIYEEAQKEDVQRKDLEQYILDKLSNS
ncbi:MAG: hypothetical protein KAQ94_09600 [Arcobacteraceae bacterium]|nr:hypothetical protein [Arcobacteraceae bacterium]